jgi:hypothetical protein
MLHDCNDPGPTYEVGLFIAKPGARLEDAMHRLIFIFLVFGLSACSNDGGDSASTIGAGLEAVLESNESWPYEAVGILDIVEAGYGETDDPEWAVGSLVTKDDEFGVSIEIDGNVISRAQINIDSGKPVRVLLEKPKMEYGVKTYPVSRIVPL